MNTNTKINVMVDQEMVEKLDLKKLQNALASFGWAMSCFIGTREESDALWTAIQIMEDIKNQTTITPSG